MYDSYGQYVTEIINILIKYFKCSIDTYKDYNTRDDYDKIIIQLLDWNNYKMVINLREEHDKTLIKNCYKMTRFDVDRISRDIINHVEQGYLDTIRR